MCAIDHTCADIQRRRVPPLDLQLHNSSATRNDVNDPIDAANLVEVNLIDWDVVNLRLCSTRLQIPNKFQR